MKHFLVLLFLSAPAFGQLLVNDPINTLINSASKAANAANHVEVLRQWAEQLDKLNRQLRQLEDQLAVQRRIREIIGDPSAVGIGIILRDLGAAEMAKSYGETLEAIRRVTDSMDTLRRRMDGIYRELDDKTSLGRGFARDNELYRRYAVVEKQADSQAAVQKETEARARALQTDLAETLVQLRNADTQAETDKLAAKISALNGQLAHLDAQRRDEADKLWAAQILNENQAAKERQDLLERQVAEEKQSVEAVDAWQRAVTLSPTSYRTK